MPAIDQCEPQVIEALRKAGWVATHQPFAIRIDKRKKGYVYADLRLSHPGDHQTIIVTEVKCFADNRSLWDDFYQATGQYLVYRNALALNNIKAPLYLAIPSQVYESFFQEPLVRATIQETGVKIIAVALEQAEVVTWMP
jgi:hypothetical protein